MHCKIYVDIYIYIYGYMDEPGLVEQKNESKVIL